MPVLICSVFALNQCQSRMVSATAILMLGSVMVFKAYTDPACYDLRVEGLQMQFAAIVMGTV